MIWPNVGIIQPRSTEIVSIVLLDQERNEISRNLEKLGQPAQFQQDDKFVVEWCAVSNEFCTELLNGDPDNDIETLQSLWNAAHDLDEKIYKRSIRVRISNSSSGSNRIFFNEEQSNSFRIGIETAAAAAAGTTTTTPPTVRSFPSSSEESRDSFSAPYSPNDLLLPSLSQQSQTSSDLFPHTISMDTSATESHTVVAGNVSRSTFADGGSASASTATYSGAFTTDDSTTEFSTTSSTTQLQVVTRQRNDLRVEVDKLRRQCEELMTEKYSLENHVDQMNRELREQLKESHHAVHKWQLRRHLICPICTQSFSSREESIHAPLSSSSCGHTVCRSCVDLSCRGGTTPDASDDNDSNNSIVKKSRKASSKREKRQNRGDISSTAAALVAVSCNPKQIRQAKGETTACPLCGSWHAFVEQNLNQSVRGIISLLETSTPRYRC